MANIKSPFEATWTDSPPKTGDHAQSENPLMGPSSDVGSKLPVTFGDNMSYSPAKDNTPFNDAIMQSFKKGNHVNYSPESSVTSPFKDTVKK